MCTAILCGRTINSGLFLENDRRFSDQTKCADTLTPLCLSFQTRYSIKACIIERSRSGTHQQSVIDNKKCYSIMQKCYFTHYSMLFYLLHGPQRDKTFLRVFRKSEHQTSLLSYRN